RQADDRADRRRQQHGAGDPDGERQPGAPDEERRGEGADGEEAALAERDLPGEADEDVEPDGADGGDADGVDDAEPIIVERERKDEDERDDEDQPRPLGTGVAEAQLRRVRRVIDAGRGRGHGHTRSMRGWPKRPYGRTRRMRTSTRYGTTCEAPGDTPSAYWLTR